jgi:hypothetical protein
MAGDALHSHLTQARRTFDYPLFLVTHSYIAHCMGACRVKGEWSLLFLSLSPFEGGRWERELTR